MERIAREAGSDIIEKAGLRFVGRAPTPWMMVPSPGVEYRMRGSGAAKAPEIPEFALWEAELASSRLLEYEIWTRLHARGFGASHAESARQLIGRVALLELIPPVLGRALDPFPTPVRTLDALHLASLDFLRQQGQAVQLASYDDSRVRAATAMSIEWFRGLNRYEWITKRQRPCTSVPGRWERDSAEERAVTEYSCDPSCRRCRSR